MKRRTLLRMSRSDLEALSTNRLLARLKRLHQCEESLDLSDQNVENYKESDFIEFKDSPKWKKEYNDLKEILAQREHIPRD